MSERGKRVVRVLFDRERDADVVERIERQGSITGYLRTLVRRDMHDERLDYAAMKASELQTENAKLRELCGEMLDNLMPELCVKSWWCKDKDWHTCEDGECGNYTFVILARELGIEVG